MPSEAFRAQNLENVLDNALYLFSEYGVANTTLKMIAEMSGLTTRSIHNYFDSKESLVRATLKKAIGSGMHYMKQLETPAYNALSGLAQVEACFEYGLEYVFNYERSIYGIFCIAYSTGNTISRIWEQEHFAFEQYVLQLLKNAIQKGISDHTVSEKYLHCDDYSTAMMQSLHGMLHNIAFQLILCDHSSQSIEKIRKEVHCYIEMICHALSA